MKLNLINSEDKAVQNFININITEENCLSLLENVPLCSCENVYLTDCLHSATYKTSLDILHSACQRLKNSGKIKISTLDIVSLSFACIKDKIKYDDLSNILSEVSSAQSVDDIRHVLSYHKVVINSIEHEGMQLVIEGSKK